MERVADINEYGDVAGELLVPWPDYLAVVINTRTGAITGFPFQGVIDPWSNQAVIEPLGINDLGEVVGWTDFGDPVLYVWLPQPNYGLPAGSHQLDMGSLGWYYIEWADINNSGQIIAQRGYGDGYLFGEPARWNSPTGAPFTPLGPLATPLVSRINNAGEVGVLIPKTFQNTCSVPGCPTCPPCQDIETGVAGLWTSSNGLVEAGTLDFQCSDFSCVVYCIRVTGPTSVRGISDAGIVGGMSVPSGSLPPLVFGHQCDLETTVSHAYGLGFVDLGDDSALCAGGECPASSLADAVNNVGDVAGSAVYSDGRHLILWRDGQVLDLSEFATGPFGFDIRITSQINDAGQMVGPGFDYDILSDYCLFSECPEPPDNDEIITLHAPYRGPVEAWRNANSDMAYGEILNVKLKYTMMNRDDLGPQNGQVEGTWDRSMVRLFLGHDAGTTELKPGQLLASFFWVRPDPADPTTWYLPLSIKAIGTTSITESDVQDIRITYTANGECPRSSCHLLNVKIAPTTFASGVGLPWYPGNEILNVVAGAAGLSVNLNEKATDIGTYGRKQLFSPNPYFVEYEAKRYSVRLPGTNESIIIRDRDGFEDPSSSGTPDKLAIGTPWSEIAPGRSLSGSSGTNYFGPDGTVYHYLQDSGAEGDPNELLLEEIWFPAYGKTRDITFDFEERNGKDYTYQISDGSGDPANTITLTRNASDQVTAITTGDGRTWTLGIDANGYINSITPPGGLGKVYYIRDPDPNNKGHVTEIQDANQVPIYRFDYTPEGEIEEEYSNQNGTLALYKRYEYDTPSANMVTVTLYQGNGDPDIVTVYDYNYPELPGLLASITTGAETTTYTWNHNKPRGNVTIKTIQQADGLTTEFFYGPQYYDPFVEKVVTYNIQNPGEQLTLVDRTYEYWRLNEPDNKWLFLQGPRLDSSRDGLGNETTYLYNSAEDYYFHQLTNIIGPLINSGYSIGNQSEVEYEYYYYPNDPDDPNGDLEHLLKKKRVKTDTGWRETLYVRDNIGRLIEKTIAPGTPDEITTKRATPQDPLRRDGLANVIIDETGHYRRIIRDAAGRPTQIQEHLELYPQVGGMYETNIDYDINGLPYYVCKPIKDEVGNLVPWSGTTEQCTRTYYDPMQRVVEEVTGDPDGAGGILPAGAARIVNIYNNLGDVIKQTNQTGNFQRMFYDPNGRLDYSYGGTGATLAEIGDDHLSHLQSGNPLSPELETYDYDANGRLIRHDSHGGELIVQYDYDDFGRLEKLTQSGPNILSSAEKFYYDNNSDVIRQEALNANGDVIVSVVTDYDEAGRPYLVNISKEGSEDDIWQFEYYADGSEKRRLQKRYHLCNGTNNNDVAAMTRQFNDHEETKIYDAADRPFQIIQSSPQLDCAGEINPDVITQYAYDLVNNSVTVTLAANSPEARPTTYHYHPSGYVDRVTDPTGAYTEIHRDSLGRPIRERGHNHPALDTEPEILLDTYWEYTALTQKTIRKDPFSGLPDRVTTTTLSNDLRPISIASSLPGDVISISYDDADHHKVTIDFPNNDRTERQTFFNGGETVVQSVETTQGINGPITRLSKQISRNPLGQILDTISGDRLGGEQEFKVTRKYDELGRFRGDIRNSTDPRSEVTYTANGFNITSDPDGQSLTAQVIRDAEGFQKQYTTSLGEGEPDYMSSNFRGPFGHLNIVRRPGIGDTKYTHSPLGRLLTETYPDGRIVQIDTVENPDEGNIVTIRETTPGGDTSEREYTLNALGQPIKIERRENDVIVDTVHNIYDGFGAMAVKNEVFDGKFFGRTYAYDVKGNLEEWSTPDGTVFGVTVKTPDGRMQDVSKNGAPFMHFEYDGSNVSYIGIASPDNQNNQGPVIEYWYTYDEKGRLTEVLVKGRRDNDPPLVDTRVINHWVLTRDPKTGLPKELAAQDSGDSTKYFWNTMDRLMELQVQKVNDSFWGSIFALKFSYDYAVIKRVATSVETLFSDDQVKKQSKVFEYEPGTKRIRKIITTILNETYTLYLANDDLGRVLYKVLVDSSGTVVKGSFYNINASGELISVHPVIGSPVLDGNGFLVSAAYDPTPQVSYVYGAEGQRVAKDVDGVRTYEIYSGGNLTAELNGDTNTWTTYIPGPLGYFMGELKTQEGTGQFLNARYYSLRPGGSPATIVSLNQDNGDYVVDKRLIHTYPLILEYPGSWEDTAGGDRVIGPEDLDAIRSPNNSWMTSVSRSP